MSSRARNLLMILALVLAVGATDAPSGEGAATTSFIVRTEDGAAARLVREAGGEVIRELEIIDAVGALLTAAQARRLAAEPGVRLHPDRAVRAAARPELGGAATLTDHPALVGATALHRQGVTGRDVTVAVLDTGIWSHPGLTRDGRGEPRRLTGVDFSGETTLRDRNGHGTHVAATIVDSQGRAQRWNGVAPDAGLAVVKAFDGEGVGSYASVIAGIQWVVEHRERLGIRVLNLSFSAAPLSFYWDDPLALAVMQAWRAGVVVVAAAGNLGPGSMTVGVPGNVPYVITVGAMSDAVTPGNEADDYLTSFSASGPTLEGFVKPEVVAPGGHVRALMDREGRLAREHREYHDGTGYFTMSGTSQSAAVVSGVAALLLDAQPWLTPDELKCRLMAAARPAVDENGRLAYSVLRQGAGLVDAVAALESPAAGCANRGLEIDHDLAGVRHFGGRARLDAGGAFVAPGAGQSTAAAGGSGLRWSGGYAWGDGLSWAEAVEWEERLRELGGFGWGDHRSPLGFGWTDTGRRGGLGYGWTDTDRRGGLGYGWSDTGERDALGYGWSDTGERDALGYAWTDTGGRGALGYGWGDGDEDEDDVGYGWGDGIEPTLGYGWTDGEERTAVGYGWSDGITMDGYLWSGSPAVAVNPWVEQE